MVHNSYKIQNSHFISLFQSSLLHLNQLTFQQNANLKRFVLVLIKSDLELGTEKILTNKFCIY